MQNGGAVTSTSDTYIGNNATGNGTAELIGSGSSLHSDNQIIVGHNGTGSFTIGEGASGSAAQSMFVGYANGSDGAMLIQSGGTLNNNAARIGHQAGSTGDVTIDGSGSLWESAGSLHVGSDGDGTLTLRNAGAVDVGGNLIIANAAGSTGVVNIGAAEGDAAAAAGTITANAVQFGAGVGELVFNHTEADYVFSSALIGAGIVKFLAGTTKLAGDNSDFTGTIDGSIDIEVTDGETSIAGDSSGFTGTTNVTNSILRVNGQLGGATTIGAGGTLYGTGSLNSLIVASGGSVAPGNSIGTTSVVNATFNPGSFYDVEVNAAGQSDLLDASGTVTINGGTVRVTPYPNYALNTPYTIITATGGVTGTFDAVAAMPFVAGELVYTANQVDLSLAADPSTLLAEAGSRNRRAVARAIPNVSANPAVQALTFSATVAEGRAALDQLSGELHASVSAAQMREQRQIRDIALRRRPAVETQLGNGAVWASAFGSAGTIDSDGNAASVEERHRGVMVGIETQLEHGYVGAAFGQSKSRIDVNGRGSDANSTNYHAVLYGGAALTDTGLALDGGVSWTLHDIDTQRDITFSGFSGQSDAYYDAQIGQIFARMSQPVWTTPATMLKPYVEGALVYHRADAFEEDGEAGLEGRTTSNSIGLATIGLDAAHAIELPQARTVQVEGGLGWQHALGDTDVERGLSFRDEAGTGFTVNGAPIERDALVLDAGIATQLAPGFDASVSYTGLISPDARDHGFSARAGIRF